MLSSRLKWAYAHFFYFRGVREVNVTTESLVRIRAAAERVAQTLGLEIWDVQNRREPTGHVVRIYIDRQGPGNTVQENISIDDCAQVSRQLGTILDVEEPLLNTYTLEVSSPGLDRPLRNAEDYRRFTGCLVKIVVSEPVDNQKAFEGRLRGVDNGVVLLENFNGRLHRLPVVSITRGRLAVEF